MGLRNRFNNIMPEDDEVKLASQNGTPAPAFQQGQGESLNRYGNIPGGGSPSQVAGELVKRDIAASQYGNLAPEQGLEKAGQAQVSAEKAMQAANMIGSVGEIPEAIMGNTAQEAVEAAKALPATPFGRILQVIKERPAFEPKPVDYTKILRKR